MSETFGYSPLDNEGEKKLGHLERVLLALRQREAYSGESEPLEDRVEAEEAYTSVPYIEFRKDEADFVRRFLDFKKEPPENMVPSYILVPSTSPIIDRDRFEQRIDGSIEFARKYPDSKVVYAGNMPSVERRTKLEDRPEAELMAEVAIERGVEESRIEVEPGSGHVKENIEFFLRDHKEEILKRDEKTNILIVASQTMLRRCYYASGKLIKEQFPELEDKIEIFLMPAGDDLNDPENCRVKYYDQDGNFSGEGGYFSFYEARRLLEYRKKGWL